MKRNFTPLIMIVCLTLFLSPSLNLSFQGESWIKNPFLYSEGLKTSITFNTTIIINDGPGKPQNWTWAKDQGICTGSGSENDPYIIKGHFFNTGSISSNSIEILHSRKFFRIENCVFNTSYYFASILLTNTTNGYITQNMALPNAGTFVWLYNSSYNIVYNNNASYCYFYGITIESLSHHNIISTNVVTDNLQLGIYLRFDANLNIIENNIVQSNKRGIGIDMACDNNTIKGNDISNSSIEGLSIINTATNNTLYGNCFFNNTLHARDNGANNNWDFTGTGNYWDNYTGLDANYNEIGDTPYNITGTTGSEDHYPLMKYPIPKTPSVVIPPGGIIINDLPGNPQNWIWAKVQGLCTGSGSENDPYIIKDHFFDTKQYPGTSLQILNSRKYFRIEKCLFNTSINYASIRLFNTTNGYLSENVNLPGSCTLIWLVNSSYNIIITNNASFCESYGILVDQFSNKNLISENILYQNLQSGIYLRNDSNFNTIEENIIASKMFGIVLNSLCDNNTIKGNIISNCTEGVSISLSASNNIVFANCFINNTLHAIDNGNNNAWDFESKGNYWDDYTGTDANNDGTGDMPYDITGTAASKDNYPVMNCKSPIIPPIITPGYELTVIISGILITLIGIIFVIYRKKSLKF